MQLPVQNSPRKLVITSRSTGNISISLTPCQEQLPVPAAAFKFSHSQASWIPLCSLSSPFLFAATSEQPPELWDWPLHTPVTSREPVKTRQNLLKSCLVVPSCSPASLSPHCTLRIRSRLCIQCWAQPCGLAWGSGSLLAESQAPADLANLPLPDLLPFSPRPSHLQNLPPPPLPAPEMWSPHPSLRQVQSTHGWYLSISPVARGSPAA
ncbi:hypothetical protein P7K49_024652 [Saguinus oedipus]|uniref:Uncharacterized protein n=1 Tax=Saguinus oedipus TaxID=9490 RepID=A0ABQ9UQU9_SAGOE|nr:hypothetical protein P7K49_024652 [Saguinus oedipus]